MLAHNALTKINWLLALCLYLFSFNLFIGLIFNDIIYWFIVLKCISNIKN